MKKILVLVSNEGINKKLVDFLKEDLKTTSEISYHTFSEITVLLSHDKFDIFVAGKNLTDFDLVYFRRTGRKYMFLGSIMAFFLDNHKIKYIDAVFGSGGPSGNKLYVLTKLALAKLPIVPSVYFEKKEHIVNKSLTYPLIAKKLTSHYSKGIYLIKSPDDIKSLAESTGYIFQNLVDIQNEYRFLVLGDSVKVVYKFKRARSNFIDETDYESKDIFWDLDSIPKDMKDLAVKAAKVLELNIAGVDLAVDTKGKTWIIEVNRGPGFNQDDKLSPELPEISKYFKKLLGV